MKLIAQGAEAKIFKENNKIIKERIRKNYRNKDLDEFLRKSRTKKELKILADLRRAGVKVPRIIDSDKYMIILEYIDGDKLKDVLDRKNFEKHCKRIGEIVAKMHDGDIIHGDLTTSNLLVKNNELYLIDFGLSKETSNLEQKAADLLTLYQNFKAIHPEFDCWKYFLQGYKSNETEKVLKTFEKMMKRRRYI